MMAQHLVNKSGTYHDFYYMASLHPPDVIAVSAICAAFNALVWYALILVEFCAWYKTSIVLPVACKTLLPCSLIHLMLVLARFGLRVNGHDFVPKNLSNIIYAPILMMGAVSFSIGISRRVRRRQLWLLYVLGVLVPLAVFLLVVEHLWGLILNADDNLKTLLGIVVFPLAMEAWATVCRFISRTEPRQHASVQWTFPALPMIIKKLYVRLVMVLIEKRGNFYFALVLGATVEFSMAASGPWRDKKVKQLVDRLVRRFIGEGKPQPPGAISTYKRAHERMRRVMLRSQMQLIESVLEHTLIFSTIVFVQWFGVSSHPDTPVSSPSAMVTDGTIQWVAEMLTDFCILLWIGAAEGEPACIQLATIRVRGWSLNLSTACLAIGTFFVNFNVTRMLSRQAGMDSGVYWVWGLMDLGNSTALGNP